MNTFWHNYSEIRKEYQIEFGQGNTPTHRVSNDDYTAIIKDETRNPTGSFKDRGLSYQIARHIQDGKTKFAISSSGNSAISASFIAKLYKLRLCVFVSDSIQYEKLNRINDIIKRTQNITLFKSQKPRSDLIKFLRNNPDFTSLRGSTDEYALQGYKSIAYEIIKSNQNIDAIFIPTSSGTSALGIASGFSELDTPVQIHICQTEKVYSIAKVFDSNFQSSKSSLADAITDKVAHRKEKIVEVINQSQGFGWVISDTELIEAKSKISSYNIGEYSYNSILAYSGLQKALQAGYSFTNPILLFSGL